MKYKVGDKVKIHDCEGDPAYNGKIGTVIETDRMKRLGTLKWDYLCSFVGLMDYVFGPNEMEKVVTKGQQLLFSFMSKQ